MTTRDKSAAGQIFAQMTRGRDMSGNLFLILADITDDDEGDGVLGGMYLTLLSSEVRHKVYSYVGIEKGGVAVTSDKIDKAASLFSFAGNVKNIMLGYDTDLTIKLTSFLELVKVVASKFEEDFTFVIIQEGSRKKNEEAARKISQTVGRKHLGFSTMTRKIKYYN